MRTSGARYVEIGNDHGSRLRWLRSWRPCRHNRYTPTGNRQDVSESRHRVVTEVPTDHSVRPLTHDSNRLMTSAFQLIPNSQQHRTLFDRQSQWLKPLAFVGTTTVCEAPEAKSLRLT